MSTSTVPAFAAGGQTGNLAGTVVDATTGAPIASATIAAVSPSGRYSSVTDGRGNFSVLGLTVDTYAVSVQAKGYESVTLSGVTLIGDQNQSLGTVRLSKGLVKIGGTRSRSVTSAFQPGQTVDSVTISGDRATQTTGKAASNDERSLVLAAPGVTLTNTGNISIRGGLTTEVGYQFDGVPYTEPFFSQNGSSGRFNGLGSLQVVEGAGDATQGNVGGGVINIVPKRGTYPGTGLLDTEIGGPNFNHQLAFEYGLASRDGRISDYFAYNGERSNPYYGTSGANAAAFGTFYAPLYETNDDFVNNFVLKFGRNNNQSFQVLYQNRLLRDYGFAGGYANQQYYTADPASYLGANGAVGYLQGVLGATAGLNAFQNLIGLNPGVPTTGTRFQTSSEQYVANPTQLVKFEYDYNISPNTLLQARYFNFSSLNGTFENTGLLGGNTDPQSTETGGRRSGLVADLTRQFGTKHTTTLHVEYQNQDPIWNGLEPQYALVGALAGNVDPTTNQSLGGAPSIADFVPAVNGICPITGAAPSAAGCYLSQFFKNGAVPRIPIPGINYHQSIFQNAAIALRDQWAVTNKLRLDYGVRVDGENYKIGANPITAGEPFALSNPSDVPFNTIGPKYNNPRVVEPRFALAFTPDSNDSIRASYGRSVEFLNAQTYGTPAALYNYQPFMKVAPVPGFACGSGVAGAPFAGPCANYAQQLFWLYDQRGDAPDLGNAQYAAYTNYDLTLQHQFKGGLGLRLTPFYREGTNVPGFAILSATINPVTQALQSYVFTVNNSNISKSTGAEVQLTTPEVASGFSGFLSMTYQNVQSRVTPLLSGEDALPSVFDTSIALGDTYRSGYASPFVARFGGEFKTKFGLRVNPILNYIQGYPYTLGTNVASNGFCGVVANVPQVNFGCGSTYIPGYEGVTAGFSAGGATSTQYVDPALPGNTFKPNIAATRGTPQTSSSGGVLSKSQLTADLSLEYKLGGRNTIGMYVQNLLGNQYVYSVPATGTSTGGIPQLNPFYQPVATGVAGPQTGKNALANPAFGGGIYQNRGESSVPASAYGTSPYLTVPTTPTRYTLYYQLAL